MVSLFSICGSCITVIYSLVVIRVEIYVFRHHAFEIILVGQLAPTVEINYLQSCFESKNRAILLTTSQHGQGLRLLEELSVKVLSGTILVR